MFVEPTIRATLALISFRSFLGGDQETIQLVASPQLFLQPSRLFAPARPSVRRIIWVFVFRNHRRVWAPLSIGGEGYSLTVRPYLAKPFLQFCLFSRYSLAHYR